MKSTSEPEPDFPQWLAELDREAARQGCPGWQSAGQTQESRDYWYGFYFPNSLTPAQALEVHLDDREETLRCLDCGAVSLWKAWNAKGDHCPACGGANPDIARHSEPHELRLHPHLDNRPARRNARR